MTKRELLDDLIRDCPMTGTDYDLYDEPDWHYLQELGGWLRDACDHPAISVEMYAEHCAQFRARHILC